MTVTFDEMPGLEITVGASRRYVFFQSVVMGWIYGEEFRTNHIFDVAPYPEQKLLFTLVTNYITAQRVAARLRA